MYECCMFNWFKFFFKRLNLNKLKLKGNEKIEVLYRKNKCENVYVLY